MKNISVTKQQFMSVIKKTNRRFLYIFGLIVAALLILLYFRGKNSELHYKTQPLSLGNITESITASGTINPLSTVSIGTQASGRIAQIYVDYNSQVKEGELLGNLRRTS